MKGTVRKAISSEADALYDLYAKALRSCGMQKCCEDRVQFVAWLASECEAGKITVIEKEAEIVALMNVDAEKSELITVVVKDGLERQGLAHRLVETAQANADYLKTIPATRGGKGLVTKCGFTSKGRDEMHWEWSRPAQSSATANSSMDEGSSGSGS